MKAKENIFFLMLYYIDDTRKNNTKLYQQMQAAQKMGYSVYYIGIDGDKYYLCNDDDRILSFKGKQSRVNLINRIQMCRCAIKVIKKQIVRFEYAYIRMMTPTLSYCELLKAIKQSGTKTIVEIPTYPPNAEIGKDKRFFHRNLYKVFSKIEPRYSQYVDLYLAIGDKCNEYLGRPAINIQNGIDVGSLERWEYKGGKSKSEVHFIALANFCYWHGYERVVEGLSDYYNKKTVKPNIFIHFVGPDEDGSLEEWKQLGIKNRIDQYLIIEGKRFGKELDEIFSICDCAIASLGGYKRGVIVDSSLKSLNYLARGIPFIHAGISYEADDINPYLYKVAANDTAIDFEDVITFLSTLPAQSEVCNALRNYCNNNCSWEKQIKAAIDTVDRMCT